MSPQNQALLAKHDLEFLAPTLDELALTAVALIPSNAGERDGIYSKFGGSPDLLSGFEWPLREAVGSTIGKGDIGAPLDFLMQLRLDEVPSAAQLGLPSTGLRSFFFDIDAETWGFDPDDRSASRVIYTPVLDSVAPYHPPSTSEWSLHEHAIDFAAEETYPDTGSDEFDCAPALQALSREQRDRYHDFRGETEGTRGSLNRLLGYSTLVQGDMHLEAQLVTNGVYFGNAEFQKHPRYAELAEGAQDWLTLLQIDSDDALNVQWGDCGILYFWIRRQDLVAKQFDQIWVGLQCF